MACASTQFFARHQVLTIRIRLETSCESTQRTRKRPRLSLPTCAMGRRVLQQSKHDSLHQSQSILARLRWMHSGVCWKAPAFRQSEALCSGAFNRSMS